MIFPKNKRRTLLANIRRGAIAEENCERKFTREGWESLPCKLPNGTGFDHVFEKDGEVKIVDTKSGNAQLGKTLNGEQMSLQWIGAKLEAMDKAGGELHETARTVREAMSRNTFSTAVERMSGAYRHRHIDTAAAAASTGCKVFSVTFLPFVLPLLAPVCLFHRVADLIASGFMPDRNHLRKVSEITNRLAVRERAVQENALRQLQEEEAAKAEQLRLNEWQEKVAAMTGIFGGRVVAKNEKGIW